MRASPQHKRALPYVAAFFVVSVTLGIRLMLDPVFGLRALLLPFTLAVMIAGWYGGGFGAGLFATLLSAACVSYFWMPPLHHLHLKTPGDRLELGIFIAAGVAISLLYHAVAVGRVRAENYAAELKRREDLHCRILETATEGIGMLDSNGDIAFANSSMAEMLGVSRSELLGKSALEFLDSSDRLQAVRRFHESLAGGRSEVELLLRRRDQEPLWVHVSSAPMPDSEGVLVMFADLTARMHAEKERERLLESEGRAREEAEAANAGKDEFLAAVSHELRTPLTAMLGWLSMMRAGTLDAAKRERALEVIERNARSQAKLIEDLLDVSRMTSGTLRLEQRCVAVGEVLESALETVGPIAAEKEIRVERRVEASSDLVLGDPERLKQVVVNLLTNAVRFTHHGGRIKLSLEGGGDELAIIVEDDGQGIPPEFLPDVFERFRQQEGGITRKHGGLGLGLTIARHLVERHGGRISAHSDGVGHGAKFVVSLPPLPAAERARYSDLWRATQKRSSPESGGRLIGKHILVVDDASDSLDMLRELLSNMGAIVSVSSSVREALAHASEFQPDLIVSDLAMPEADGYDLIAGIRSLPGDRGRTPAIALTAHARTTDRVGALTSGFQAYLAKPVEPEELVETATRLVVAAAEEGVEIAHP